MRFLGFARASSKGQVYPGGHHSEQGEGTGKIRLGVDRRTLAGGPQELHQLADGMLKQRLGYLSEDRPMLGPGAHSVGDSRRMKRRDRRYCQFLRGLFLTEAGR